MNCTAPFFRTERGTPPELMTPFEHAAAAVCSPQQLLLDAADVIAQRGAERDTTGAGQQQERSMADTVTAFNAIEGTALTERQGWAFMQILKAKRAASAAKNNRCNLDDYLDGAAYAALGAEAAFKAHLLTAIDSAGRQA